MNIKLAIAMGAASVALFSASAAMADINPAAPGTPTITAVSNGFAYTYPIVLTSTETLVSGNYFTFFDVAGLVPKSETTQAGFTASEALSGPVATGTLGSSPTKDDPTLLNVTYTYNGPTVVGFSSLGNFGFTSIYGTASTLEPFSAVAEKSGSTILNSNNTTYTGPTVGPAAVPEPATTVPFVIGGLALLGMVVRKTRRASSASA